MASFARAKIQSCPVLSPVIDSATLTGIWLTDSWLAGCSDDSCAWWRLWQRRLRCRCGSRLANRRLRLRRGSRHGRVMRLAVRSVAWQRWHGMMRLERQLMARQLLGSEFSCFQLLHVKLLSLLQQFRSLRLQLETTQLPHTATKQRRGTSACKQLIVSVDPILGMH